MTANGIAGRTRGSSKYTGSAMVECIWQSIAHPNRGYSVGW